MASPLVVLGIIVFVIGLIVFLFGKQFFWLRAFFGDPSMFSQIFWGLVICVIGGILMYSGGAFQ